MKKHITTIILILVLIAGLSLLLYPFVSNWWNERVQTKAIASYVEAVENKDVREYASMLEAAVAYNETLVGNPFRYQMDDEESRQYESLLDVTESGIMAYIEIPAINVTLAIYHGTSEELLQAGVGHLEGSSLPVGGKSTHCVLSGHRGLPAAKLFTNLNELEVGDVFYVHTLNQLLTYQVDQISIVLPHETDALEIVRGEDYCTLVTCTPYGVNSHRLLVRGTRIENPEEAKQIYITAEASEIDSLLLAPIISIPILLVLFLVLVLKPRKRKNLHKNKKEGREPDDERSK